MVTQLTKSSSQEDIRLYFQQVLKLSQAKDGNEFPINLDEVWPLVYARKDMAVRSLKQNFFEGVDYQPLRKNAEQKTRGGHNEETYHLTLSCLEYFIARKVRPVFEVYRQVFHRVAQAPALTEPASRNYETRLDDLEARYDGRLQNQWKRILEAEAENKRLEQQIRELTGRIEQERTWRTVKEAWFLQIADELKAFRREVGKLPAQKPAEPQPDYGEYLTVYDYAKQNGYDTDHRLMVAMGHLASELCRQKGVKKRGTAPVFGKAYPSKCTYPIAILKELFAKFPRKEAAL